MKAAQSGYTAIVELLIEAGANKNARDKVRALVSITLDAFVVSLS